MIKTAEIQQAYLQGRQAAFEKIAGLPSGKSLAYGTAGLLGLGGLYAGVRAKLRKPEELMGPPEPTDPVYLATKRLKEFNEAMREAGAYQAKSPEDDKDKAEPQPGLLDMVKREAAAELQDQNEVRNLIGLGTQGLTRAGMVADTDRVDSGRLSMDDKFIEDYTYPGASLLNYATMENLSRAGILAGTLAGAGEDPMSYLRSGAGAVGGALVGGNLGRAVSQGVDAYRNSNDAALRQQIISSGGALGGLSGGLASSYLP